MGRVRKCGLVVGVAFLLLAYRIRSYNYFPFNIAILLSFLFPGMFALDNMWICFNVSGESENMGVGVIIRLPSPRA